MFIKIFLIGLLVLCLIAFFLELVEARKDDKEYEEKIGVNNIKEYIERTFGKREYHIFKSTVDENEKVNFLIYFPHYEWFKTPTYEWFDVYYTTSGYTHEKVERD